MSSVVLDELCYGVLRLPEDRREEGFARAAEVLAARNVKGFAFFDLEVVNPFEWPGFQTK